MFSITSEPGYKKRRKQLERKHKNKQVDKLDNIIKQLTNGPIGKQKGNHRLKGKYQKQWQDVHIDYYLGRQRGFECCVCNKGTNAYTFNIWSSSTDYETWDMKKSTYLRLLKI